ncbi:MAG TPA: transcriptional repressor, partial [Candidatus Eremiobacteraceae bacterium]|nr:transcriptional repressor [Candidatus Eremiobacteraceae bacterium]
MSADAVTAVKKALAAHAFRVTAQRLSIVGEFASIHRYVTARQLHERCKRKGMAVGLATVYRTLEMLRAIGAASAAPHERGETMFLYCPTDHHHHAVCTKCGEVADVPCRSLGPIERNLRSSQGFRLQ